MNHTTPMSAQFAIRNEGKNVVHVQIIAPKGTFINGYGRSYGGAFNIRNADLYAAIEAREAVRPSKAGTGRLYVPGTLANNGDLEVTVTGTLAKSGSKVFGAVKSFGSKVFGTPEPTTVKLAISDDDVFEG